MPPTVSKLPKQEKGTRPSRALGYNLDVHARVTKSHLTVEINNHGRLGIHLQARSQTLAGAPYSYTVGAGRSLAPSWPITDDYDVSWHGPNGFFRRFAGDNGTGLEVELNTEGDGKHLTMTITNSSARATQVMIVDRYSSRHPSVVRLGKHDVQHHKINTQATGGWYELTVTVDDDRSYAREFAGRIETGRPSISDPQLGS